MKINFKTFRVTTFSLLLGLLLAASITLAWSAIWHGTAWIQPGRVISADGIAENFEFLYQKAGKLPTGGCPNAGDILQWDGTEFICTSLDAAGGAGACSNTNTILANGDNTTHTVADCLSLGGTAVDTIDGCLCKLSRTTLSCPSGWAMVSNWSTTTNKTCTPYGSGSCYTSCSTGSHDFANQAVETCRYANGQAGGDGSMWCNYYTCSASISAVGCK